MKRILIALSAALCLAASNSAPAQRYYADGDDYVWATVVRVEPIVVRSERPIQREECWNEPVVTYREGRRSDNRTPAIIGALVGGAIGNRIGDGRGRDAATVAGAALGYHVVRDAQRRNDYYVSRRYEGYERRCAVRTDYVRDSRVRAYDVTYRYDGEYFHTTTHEHPGRRIWVRAPY